MIAKIPAKRRDSRSSFKALTDYCLGISGHAKGSVLHVGFQNINSPKTAAVEMSALATENRRCKDPAFHFILSWRETESPTIEQVDEAVKIALTELDLLGCQALWALQSDTENMHVHVAVNRIDPETYRAIHAAGGWTKKALERAARKIEFKQGWDVEMSGRYAVDENGNVAERTEVQSGNMKLSTKARDIEAHTGRESIERIAKIEIAPILKSALSWDELHEKLAKRGFVLERKGSGAVLRSGNSFVKLSRAARECGISQLEKRLGAFRERRDGLEISQRQETPVERITGDCEAAWKRYNAERSAYLAAKTRAINELKEIFKTERNELHSRHSEDRKDIYAHDWRGRGKELNQLRSLYAYAQKKERLELGEMQRMRLNELKTHFLRRFPSYKNWLAAQESEDLYRVYRYPGTLVLTPEQSGVIKVPAQKHLDLRDYSAIKGAGFSVLYCRGGGFTADFSDMGKRIVLNKNKLDETSVAAALQLANQKWGATQINGSAEYKELCVSVAVKYGLRLANPELAVEVERRRNALRNTQKQEITKEEIEALHLAENPRIYLNPRTDNQQYKGEIVHVNLERGFCVQRVGKESLFVHRLERLETSPQKGENVRIFYKSGSEKAKVERQEMRQRTLSL